MLRLATRFVEVEPLYTRALAIWQKTLGTTHPDYARGLSNLADYYRTRGSTGDAITLYNQSIAILENALGTHPSRSGAQAHTVGGTVSGAAAIFGNGGDIKQFAAVCTVA